MANSQPSQSSSQIEPGDRFEQANPAPGHSPMRARVVRLDDVKPERWAWVVYSHSNAEHP